MFEEVEQPSFLVRLDYLLNKTGKDKTDLSDGAKIPRGTIDTWYNRKVTGVHMNYIRPICSYLKVKEFFFFADCKENELDIIYEKYRTDKEKIPEEIDISEFNEEQKREIISFISYIKNKANEKL